MLPNQIILIDLKTGKRQLWKESIPADPAGIRGVAPFLTPDGKSYAYAYYRQLSGLYVIDGLK